GTPAGPAPDPYRQARRQWFEDLAALPQGPDGGLSQFVQRAQLQTYDNLGRLRKILDESLKANQFGGRGPGFPGGDLARNLNLVARMVNADFGTRVFYLSVSGF